MRIWKISVLAALALAALSSAGAPLQLFELDPDAEPIRDQRQSRCGVGLGFAGSLVEGVMAEYFFVSNRTDTAAKLREAGVYFVREWHALHKWQRNREYAALTNAGERAKWRAKEPATAIDAHEVFSFRKENNIRVLLTLEQWSAVDPLTGLRTNDVQAVKRAVGEYLQWIVDNGYSDQVAGLELGNETYFHPDPRGVAERWAEIIPEIRRVMPDVPIGIPLAEYSDNDPDVVAVRNRLLAEGAITSTNAVGLGLEKLNAWNGHFVTALSNQLHNVTHLIYHFYGGDAAYGCSMSGFKRIEKFGKDFPEVRGKKIWITEWRERSDEDNRCHQTFFSTLFKGHYMLLGLSMPDLEGMNTHSLDCLSGALYIARGNGNWYIQWDSAGHEYVDLDFTGHPRIYAGPSGPLFRLFNEALLAHPIILEHGNQGSYGKGRAQWGSAMMYGNWVRHGHVEWAALLSPEKDSAAIIAVNSSPNPRTLKFKFNGKKPGMARVRTVSCPPDRFRTHIIPGEVSPLTETDVTREISPDGETLVIEYPACSVHTVTVPLK